MGLTGSRFMKITAHVRVDIETERGGSRTTQKVTVQGPKLVVSSADWGEMFRDLGLLALQDAVNKADDEADAPPVKTITPQPSPTSYPA